MQDFFASRGISVQNHIPHRVKEKARRVIQQLEQGKPYWQMQGKRLRKDRSVISIPIGRRWRLVVLDCGSGEIQPKELLSHGQYDNRF
jgi:hypothetical protein